MADSGYHEHDDGAQRPVKRRRRDDASPGHEGRLAGRRRHGSNERHHDHSRRRSRSPDATRHDPVDSNHRRYHHRRERRGSPKHTTSRTTSVQLPYDARPLSKSELDVFRPLLARYLDVQKNKDMGDMDEREVRGRWKSFLAKWNDGALASSWYDPELFEETRHSGLWDVKSKPRTTIDADSRRERMSPHGGKGTSDLEQGERKPSDGESGDEGDDYGPVLPGSSRAYGRMSTRQGPGIPSLQDLEVQREMNQEDRHDRITQLRQERKADRLEQKARLEDLVPRAEAGTRERKLEKKKEINEKMKGFRERSPGAAEVNDGELMGGGDSLDELKRMKASVERRKTEKEIRREEILRAKNEEREERLREYREKEEKAMVMLKELARQRFG